MCSENEPCISHKGRTSEVLAIFACWRRTSHQKFSSHIGPADTAQHKETTESNHTCQAQRPLSRAKLGQASSSLWTRHSNARTAVAGLLDVTWVLSYVLNDGKVMCDLDAAVEH